MDHQQAQALTEVRGEIAALRLVITEVLRGHPQGGAIRQRLIDQLFLLEQRVAAGSVNADKFAAMLTAMTAMLDDT